MLPISDTAPRKSFPLFNYLIIILNVLVFLNEIVIPNSESFIYQYAFIPIKFNFLDIFTYWPLIASLFMHGGWLHLISNMWFLFIFGDNVEDRLGHLHYFFFYLAGGIISMLAQYVFIPEGTIPLIGASGAISAVVGAYFIFFRSSKVKTLIPIFIFLTAVDLPVWFFVGYWFALQVFSGVGTLVAFSFNQGGIAWFAHIGGFIYGNLIASRGAGERT